MPETSQTVARALQVLRLFDRQHPEMNASQVARDLDLPRTIVARILKTLEEAGFVERGGPDSTYRVGLAACELGALYLVGNPLVQVADDVLQDLAETTGYTAYLGAMYGDDVVILSHREGRLPIRFTWSAGDRLPVATTSLGKAMLMHLSPVVLDELLGRDRLVGLTESSLRTRAELDRQIEAARPMGWIAAVEESYPGICAVGSAVLDSAGRAVAGISLSYLRTPDEAALQKRLGGLVRDAAASITARVVAYGPYGERRLWGSQLNKGPANEEGLQAFVAGERDAAVMSAAPMLWAEKRGGSTRDRDSQS